MSKKGRGIKRQIEYAKKQGKYFEADTRFVSQKEAVKENNKRHVFGKDDVLDVQCGTLGIYAIYDAELGKFGTMSTAPNHVAMVRFLSTSMKNGQVLNPDWLVSKELYSLYLLGYFSEDGSIKSLDKPVKVINFSEI